MSELHVLFTAPQGKTREAILARGRDVIRIEAEALGAMAEVLDDRFVDACELVLGATGRVVITGMGKSGHVSRKLAATFAATGTPALFLHPAEAAHGDLGVLVPGDVLIVLSNSGNTSELRAVLAHARATVIRIIGIAARAPSMVIDQADVALLLPSRREACAANVAPTTSTALQMAMGDAIAMSVMDMRGVTLGNLRQWHPGGSIGLRLTPIAELMHGVEHLPLVGTGTGMSEVISVITQGRFGLAGVTDGHGQLVGVISDGDLRRHFEELGSACAADVMTRNPCSIPADMMAADALMMLNDAKITAAFVLNRLNAAQANRPIGIIHMHDLLNYGLE